MEVIFSFVAVYLDKVCVQSECPFAVSSSVAISNVTLSGEPRIQRLLEMVSKLLALPFILVSLTLSWQLCDVV